jgi:hypothetical protein
MFVEHFAVEPAAGEPQVRVGPKERMQGPRSGPDDRKACRLWRKVKAEVERLHLS